MGKSWKNSCAMYPFLKCRPEGKKGTEKLGDKVLRTFRRGNIWERTSIWGHRRLADTLRGVSLSAPTKARLFSRSVWHVDTRGHFLLSRCQGACPPRQPVFPQGWTSLSSSRVSGAPLPHPLDAKGTSGCGQHREPVRGGPSAAGVTVPSEPGTDGAPAR